MTQKYQMKKAMNKISFRFFLLIFMLFGFILSGTIGFIHHLETKAFLQRLKLEEQVNLKLQLRLITKSFEAITSDLLFLSEQNELQRMINDHDQQYRPLISNEYLELCRRKRMYDQIRYLDEKGMEIIRVNFNNGDPEIVEQRFLQSKATRYYFKGTFALNKNEIFVSPMDLNIEKGEIEKPFKPMIRFGLPIFDHAGNKRGVIILNYLGAKLIDLLKETSKSSIMLVNSEGYWLCSPEADDEWGFIIKERNNRKFSNSFAETWDEIVHRDSSQLYNKNGLFTSATVYPLKEVLKSSSGLGVAFGDNEKEVTHNEYFWKIISHVSARSLKSGSQGLFIKLSLMAVLLILLASIPSWIIAKAIVKRRLHQMELFHSANYDNLTDLPNRSLFYDRLSQTLKQAKRYKRRFALMYIDLDGFKSINDTLGHDAGDELLIKTAKRLLDCVRDSDTVARMGGDEFTIILNSLSSAENSETVAKRIVYDLSTPFEIKGNSARIGASIGVSLFPENGEDVEILLKKADDAMYQTKKSGKSDYRFSS